MGKIAREKRHIIKRGCVLTSCFALLFLMTACNKHSEISGYYSNFTAKGDTDTYKLLGKAHVANGLPFLYFTSSENTEIDIQGDLKGISGKVEIVYVGANSENIIVSIGDKNKDIDINIQLESGDGRIEFRGDNINFKFDLSVKNIDREKVEYLGTEIRNQEERTDNGAFILENLPNSNLNFKNQNEVLQEAVVLYTSNDNSCIVLNTELSEETKLNVSVGASVFNTDENESTSFNGFKLAYKTEADEEIEVIKYDEKTFTIGGYEWQDNFSREIELPKGTNKLIFQNTEGDNYKIVLEICVSKVK